MKTKRTAKKPQNTVFEKKNEECENDGEIIMRGLPRIWPVFIELAEVCITSIKNLENMF